MKARLVKENIEFKKTGSTQKSLGLGKYRPYEVSFNTYDGRETIKVANNGFEFRGLDVRLEFRKDEEEDENAEFLSVYIDGEKSDIKGFKLYHAEYEFFVPKKDSVEIDGKWQSDPNPENWSKTESAYGFPLVDKNDKKKLKEMQDEYSTWYVYYIDFNREARNPFIAVAQIIALTH